MKLNIAQLLAVTWGYALLLVFFGLFTGRVNPLFFGPDIDTTFTLYAHAAEIGQICCLFLAALLAYRWQFITERLAPHAALVLLVAGYALTLWQAIESDTPPFMSSVAGAVFGCGQGACFLCWLCVYSRFSQGRVVTVMTISSVLSGLILLLIGFIPSTVMLFGALSIIVAACCALTYYCLNTVPLSNSATEQPYAQKSGNETSEFANKESDTESQTARFETKNSKRNKKDRSLPSWVFVERRFLLCLVAVAFVCGAQRVISLENFVSSEFIAPIFSIGYIVGALIFWATSKIQGEMSTHYRTCFVLLIIMATCGVLSSFVNVQIQTVLYAVDNIAFTVVSICVILTSLEITHEFRSNPLFICGIVCGAMYFSIQLGRIVCTAVTDLAGINATGILIVSVIILYVVALATISSGLFVRQSVRSNDASTQEDTSVDEAGEDEIRPIVSIANITEEQLRTNPIYRQTYKLTDREIDVTLLLLAGYNSTDIAKILNISINTVKTHLKNLYAKTGVHNRRELIALLNEIENQEQT